jgi:hypothetical protein
MASEKRLYLPTLKIIPEILPRRLHRTNVPDYLRSRTFERRFGNEFPRREVLLKLAASAAAIALPVRSARAISASQIIALAKGTLDCAVEGLELFDKLFRVNRRTNGQCDVNNEEATSKSGTLILVIFDDAGELEISEGRSFKIPRKTTAKFTFHGGPAPQETGNKTYACAAEEDADSVEIEVT